MELQAKWICHPDDGKETPLVPVFWKEFQIKEGLKSAKMRITSHGIYETILNGKTVTDHKFTPGLTSYYHRIQVQTYDVKNFLREGNNVWQTTVGDGWWRWEKNYGYRLALLAELILEYEDHTEVIGTDESFLAGTGPVVRTDLREGEVYAAGTQPSGFKQAIQETFHTDVDLIETEGVPVREKETFAGKELTDAAGNRVIDFGQNIAGYVKMNLYHTRPGQKVHLKHGEGLNPDGVFSTENCDGGRKTFQEITYICKGAEKESYTPHFAVFGFRYLLVEGAGEADFTAVAVYSDMEETGDFSCSNENINQLVKNARWSQKGNFLDVPVDCPTRERNAWTGDAQIYAKTAAYFMDVHAFFKKWLKDQTIEQYASGKVGITFPSTSSVHNLEELPFVQAKDPHMALAGPDGNGNIGEDSVGWGDAAAWIPYQMYLMYGDRKMLEDQYDTAKKWLEYSLACMREVNPLYLEKPWYVNGEGEFIYDTKFHYGEWNEPLPPDPETVSFFRTGKSPSDFVEYMAQFGKPEVATAYTKRSCDNVAHMAQILGKAKDAAYYREMSAKIKAAYNRYLIAEDGTIQEGHQAAYVRALGLDLAEKEKKPLVVAKLKEEIEKAGDHLNTGFLSTVYLLPVLCDNGLTEEAFRILEQEEAPGWLHPVMLGATTMLENWNGLDEFKDSFNHYSFGAVCEFLFEYVAGIRPVFAHPGFKEFELKPVAGGTLTWAKGSYRTKYGMIRSEWKREGKHFFYSCEVPEQTTAHLTLPDGTRHILAGGKHWFDVQLNGKNSINERIMMAGAKGKLSGEEDNKIRRRSAR